MNPLPYDEVDPKYLLDWLVVQHTCEWCLGDIDESDAQGNPVTPQREWRCREVKKNGYVSKHWKHWLVCRRCSAPRDFARWVFPIIKGMVPEHESLSAIMDVQPMAMPRAEVFYMDVVCDVQIRRDVLDGPVGQREIGVMIDDVGPVVNPCGEVALRPVTYKKWKLA